METEARHCALMGQGRPACLHGQGRFLREAESEGISGGHQQKNGGKNKGVSGKRKSICQDAEEKRAWPQEKP